MKTIEINDKKAEKIIKMNGYNPEKWNILVMEDDTGNTIGIIEPNAASTATSPTAKIVNLNKILKNLKKGDDSMNEKTLDKGIKNWQKKVEEAADRSIENWQKKVEEAADKEIEAFEKSINTK